VKGDLVIAINSATQTVQWTDAVQTGTDGAFEYTFPVLLSDVPRLILKATTGTLDPIIEANGSSSVTGVLRYPSSGTMVAGANDNTFNISGVGRLFNTNGRVVGVQPTASGANPDALTPTPQQSFSTGEPNSNFRITFAPSFVVPSDLDSNLLSSLRMSWGSTQPWHQRVGAEVPDYLITAYISDSATTPLGEGVRLGVWTGIPGVGADATGSFANTPYNQSQSFGLLGLQPGGEYFIHFDFNVEPETTENINYALNFELLSYYFVVDTVSAVANKAVSKKALKAVKVVQKLSAL
jgi:hypothetical protein